MTKRFVLLALICQVLVACRAPKTETPYKTVKWVDHMNQPITEPFSQLGYGITWRGLIWGSRLYYIGHLWDQQAITIFKVDPARREGRIYKPLPKNLERFQTLALLPGPNDQVAWCYNTQKGSVVAGIFDPDGWVLEPKEILAPQYQEEHESFNYPRAAGAAWVDDGLEFLILQGYPHDLEDKSGVQHLKLSPEGEVQSELRKWTDLAHPSVPLNRLAILGSYYLEGWNHIFVQRPEVSGINLWERDPQGQWKTIAEKQPNHFLNPASHIDRTRFGLVGFSASSHRPEDSPLYVWEAANTFTPFDMELPEGAMAWEGLYKAEGLNQLSFVPCYYQNSCVFQSVGESYLSLQRVENNAVVLDSNKPERVLFPTTEFPTGSDYKIFIEDQGRVWVTELGGRFVQLEGPVTPDSD